MCCFFIHFHPVVPDMEKAGRKSRFQTVDKVLRETSVSRSIFLCVYEIYSENRKFSLGLCHP